MLYGLRYENDIGAVVEFSTDNYRVISHEGFGEVSADVQTQKAPFQDGSTYLDSVLNNRFLFIDFLIIGDNYEELQRMRRHLGRVFSPKIKGKIFITFKDDEYEIICHPEHVPNFPDGGTDSIGRVQRVLVDLVAPNPYWQSSKENAVQMVTFKGGLTFPLNLPTIFGNMVTDDNTKVIENVGDSSAPLEVTFEGPATSPIRIENETTGEFIEVQQDLLEGEKLWISTAFGHKKVEKIHADGTRENAFHYIYVDPTGDNESSTFFSLLPGDNVLTYTTGEEYEKAPVTVRFKPRYLTV